MEKEKEIYNKDKCIPPSCCDFICVENRMENKVYNPN